MYAFIYIYIYMCIYIYISVFKLAGKHQTSSEKLHLQIRHSGLQGILKAFFCHKTQE